MPVSFSTAAKTLVALAGVLLFAVLAVLIAVLVSLEGTRNELGTTHDDVARTEQRVQQLGAGFGPVLEAAAPLVSKGSRRGVRRTARQLIAGTSELPGVADDVEDTVGITASIAERVDAANLTGTGPAVRALADAVVPLADRLVPLSDGLKPVIDDLPRRLAGLRRHIVKVRRTLRRSLAVQTETRVDTGANLELFRQSLGIQRELLVHVRSLDQKLGGTLPTAATP